LSENIAVLSGSPRKGGNTDKLAAAFIDGAESAGKKVNLFRIADMNISGCLGCGHCFEEKGVCVLKDDMVQILNALRKADAIVFASPIYFFNISAQLKIAIDRTYALLHEERPTKRAAMLITCGAGGVKAAEAAVAMYHHMRAYSKWSDAGVIIVPGLHNPGEIDRREELTQAKMLGRQI